MKKKHAHILFFLFFVVIGSNVKASQERLYNEVDVAINILRYYKKTWYLMGGKFFSPIQKLITSNLSFQDLADYRESFFESLRSLPTERRSSIATYKKNFEKNTQEDIIWIKESSSQENQKNFNFRFKSAKNMDDMLDVIDDLLLFLEQKRSKN